MSTVPNNPAPPPAVDAAGHREVFASPIGERVFKKLIAGRPFLISVLIGFVWCCIVGWQDSKEVPFKHFLRFHHWINPQTLFYPTISQMTEVAKQGLQPDQTLVIVGGDSILFGTSQLTKDIWTIHLQELLGPQYKVVVLAYPGAAFADAGAVAAEVLAKQNYKVVLLSHLFVGHLNSLENATHPYVFWQAWERGLLMDDPGRDAAAEHALTVLKEQNRLHEMPLAYSLDRYLYFEDYWTTFAYQKYGTVWQPLTDYRFYWARKKFTDPEVPTPIEARNPPRLYDTHMFLIRNWFHGLCKLGPDGRWQEDPESKEWQEFDHLATVVLPQAMHERTIAIVTYENPFYLHDLKPDETIQYNLGLQGTVKRMQDHGYDSIAVGKDFEINDYFDVIHFAPSGGEKMADLVAPEVKKVAAQLGYVKDGQP